MRSHPNRYAWIDLESTGSTTDCPIIEIAVIIATPAGEEIAHYDSVVQAAFDYDKVAPVVQQMHAKNGLWKDLEAGKGLPIQMVEQDVIDLFSKHSPETRLALAGSGVAHFDRRMIEAQMPRLAEWLTYYSIDVGVLRRFFRNCDKRMTPPAGKSETKSHRAMDDIRMHLNEYRAYRAAMRCFVEQAGVKPWDEGGPLG